MDVLERAAATPSDSDRWSDGFISSAAAVVRDAAVAAEVARSPWCPALLRNIVARMNMRDAEGDPSLPSKYFASALQLFAALSLPPAARPVVLDAFRSLGEPVDDILASKASAVAAYGTALGTLHMQCLVVVARCQDYRLGGNDVLDLMDGNVRLVVRLLVALLKVPTYEAPLRCVGYRCLADLCCPQTYVGDASELQEHRTRDFVARVDVLLDVMLQDGAVAFALGDLAAWHRRSDCDHATWCRCAALFARLFRNVLAFASPSHAATQFRQQVGAAPAVARDAMAVTVAVLRRCLGGDDDDAVAAANLSLFAAAVASGAALSLRRALGSDAVVAELLEKDAAWWGGAHRRAMLLPSLVAFGVNADLFGSARAPEPAGVALRGLAKAIPDGPAVWARARATAVEFDPAAASFASGEEWLAAMSDAQLDAVAASLDEHTAALAASIEEVAHARWELLQLSEPAPPPDLRAKPSVPTPAQAPATATPPPAPVRRVPQAADLAAPRRFCCCLWGVLMEQPVTLPTGRSFELPALQEVVSRVGHVDPITAEPFGCDLAVDTSLQAEIATWRREYHAHSNTHGRAQLPTPALPAPAPGRVRAPHDADPFLYDF